MKRARKSQLSGSVASAERPRSASWLPYTSASRDVSAARRFGNVRAVRCGLKIPRRKCRGVGDVRKIVVDIRAVTAGLIVEIRTRMNVRNHFASVDERKRHRIELIVHRPGLDKEFIGNDCFAQIERGGIGPEFAQNICPRCVERPNAKMPLAALELRES